MDFLLECIGFPPDHPFDELLEHVRSAGEPAAWRGDAPFHRKLALCAGLELRADKDPLKERWSLYPHHQTPYRLRVAVDEIRTLSDSPFDALLYGWAAPPIRADEEHYQVMYAEGGGVATLHERGAYPLCAYLTDARKLPRSLPYGHVLALNVAGFALDVAYIGDNAGAFDAAILERDHGESIEPLRGADAPGGCAEVSVRIERVLHLRNPITGILFDLIEADAPERPLQLFVSRWQLERDGLPPPRPGERIEGSFLFSGRIAGGLPGQARRAAKSFG